MFSLSTYLATEHVPLIRYLICTPIYVYLFLGSKFIYVEPTPTTPDLLVYSKNLAHVSLVKSSYPLRPQSDQPTLFFYETQIKMF